MSRHTMSRKTKAARGFTLIELCIVTLIATAVFGTSAAMITTLHRSEQRTGAYTREVSDLRRAIRALERDLRALDTAVSRANYRLDGDRLYRGDVLLARRISAFEIEQQGALRVARVELMPRAGGRRPVVVLRVRPRGREGTR